jgi:hypothetical protein
MLKKLTVITLLSTTLLTGCGKKAPKCSDQETIDTLKGIFFEKAGLDPSASDKLEIVVNDIRTSSFDKETGSYTCNASMYFNNKTINLQRTVPITYKTEILDNGKEFYVSILS